MKIETKVFFISVFIFCAFYRVFPLNRVGDGSEYILQYEAFISSHTPWITSSALNSYDLIFDSGQINYLLSSDLIQRTFSSLIVGNTFDVPHFWMYSALAAFLHFVMRIFLIELFVSDAFILLHGILFGVATTIAWSKFKARGVWSVVLLLVCSPMLWYGNKIHTEFFTFTLVVIATIYATKREFSKSALALGLASTQNPSFAAIALVLIGLEFVKNKGLVFQPKQLGLILFTSILCLIHPAYYLSRQGVVSPQFKSGGASVGKNFDNFYIWLIDPDVGLFPNWPLGIFLVILGATQIIKYKLFSRSNLTIIFFGLSFLAVSLYAQASTLNLNSGATPGLARYGLWYIGLFFAPIYLLLLTLSRSQFKTKRVTIMSILGTLTLTSIYANAPLRPESYQSPSISSRIIQTHFSEFYSPPMPIFVGRYSGIGEDLSIASVIGPDCRKIGIIMDASRTQSISPAHCNFSSDAVQQFVAKKRIEISNDKFFWISEDLATQFRFQPKGKLLEFSQGKEGLWILGKGWSQPEGWGVWTDSKKAELFLPCKIQKKTIKAVKFIVNSFGRQEVFIAQGRLEIVSKKLRGKGTEVIYIELPKGSCNNGVVSLIMRVPDAKSPKDLGISADSRKLGIGLIRAELETSSTE